MTNPPLPGPPKSSVRAPESALPEVSVHPLNDQIVAVIPRGEVDLQTAGALRRALEVATGGSWSGVLIDLTLVTFLDATGIGLFCRARNRLERRHRHLAVACPAPQVRAVLQATELMGVLDVVSTRERALAHLYARSAGTVWPAGAGD